MPTTLSSFFCLILTVSVHFADLHLLFTSSLCILRQQCCEPCFSSSSVVKPFSSWLIQLKTSILHSHLHQSFLISCTLCFSLFLLFLFHLLASPSSSQSRHYLNKCLASTLVSIISLPLFCAPLVTPSFFTNSVRSCSRWLGCVVWLMTLLLTSWLNINAELNRLHLHLSSNFPC